MSAPEPPDVAQSSVTLADRALSPDDTGTTGGAPPCPAPLSVNTFGADSLPVLAPGQIIEDYEILRELGSGGFARVYLARQISLDRQVALKVSANFGNEARTLARLEHQHIVQVFADIALPERNLRLLCMQFVPGITLARLIGCFRLCEPQTQNGQAFLAILDQLCTEPTTFDLTGLNLRAFLEKCDHIELTCWLGARIAEALAHAHSQGVIHRDIKPANILLNRYGRPSLADFNIAVNTQAGESAFGGTLSYMAPEHLHVYLHGTAASPNSVDARSDLYSLALVLFEFLTGKLPAHDAIKNNDPKEIVRHLMQSRRIGAPSPQAVRADVPDLMERLLRRCLEPNPDKRFPSAEAFMHALDGCRELVQVEKQPDQHSRLVRLCRAWPFVMMVLLGLVPHLLGSIFNVSYNALLIVNKDPEQQSCFHWLVMVYNTAAYPLILLVGVVVISRAHRGWRGLRDRAEVTPEQAAQSRRRVLALPAWIFALSCLGWIPGGVLFPAGLDYWAGPIALEDSLHFFLSFALSGLIASTYAYFVAQFVVMRILYPQMWSDPSAARAVAQQELHGLTPRLRGYQALAILIPLVGAAMLIGAGPDQLTLAFRLLVTSLIILGLAGFALTTVLCNRLVRVLTLLTGQEKV